MPLDPLVVRNVSFHGIRSRRLGELTLLELDEGRNMDVQKLKRETQSLQREAERLEEVDRPDPVKLLRLQRRARELDRKVSRAEEINELQKKLEGSR